MEVYKTAEEAVKVINSNNRIYIQAAAAAPQQLINALSARHEELRDVEICQLHTEGAAPYANPEFRDSFHVNSFFIGKNVRHTIKEGNGSYTPVFLSEVPFFFKRNILPLDAVFIHVSPPDKHGYCSLGVSVEASLAAIANAKKVIAQVNPQMPRVHGEGIIHVSEIDILVDVNEPIHSHGVVEPTEIEKKIGYNVAELIEDGSTLQMGIGSIPNAALSQLHNHKNLGLHTEMFSDGVIDLILKDVINGNHKAIVPGRALSTFLMGSKRLYDYVDDNPYVEMRSCDYTNDPSIIKRNPKMVAINSAIEVDLTGQICADSIGPNMYSGVGGQMDFMRGSSLSDGGKAIIALPSTTRRGESKIVPNLKQGAGVVTTRPHAHYIVTEYGVASLYGKSIRQRIKAMVAIAHPDHREAVEKAYFESIK